MRIVHRIPWLTPYGYTEVETEGYLEDGEAANILFDVVQLEDSYRATYGKMSVGEEIDMNQNTPPPTPPQAQASQAPASQAPSASGYYCKNCKGDATEPKLQAKKQNRDGSWSAPSDCMMGCKNPNNPRFPLSTWVLVQG